MVGHGQVEVIDHRSRQYTQYYTISSKKSPSMHDRSLVLCSAFQPFAATPLKIWRRPRLPGNGLERHLGPLGNPSAVGRKGLISSHATWI